MDGMKRGAAVAVGLVLVACAGGPADPSRSVRVSGAGWSFGFCLGACRGDLDVSGAQLTYRVSSRTGEVFAENRARLTVTGSARLESLALSLPATLRDSYGCPDCADGGASFVVLVRGSRTQRVEYEYERPPAELAALDRFLAQVMAALDACRATADVVLEGPCTVRASSGTLARLTEG